MIAIYCSTFGLRFFSKVSARACALGATLRVLSWAQRLTFFEVGLFFCVVLDFGGAVSQPNVADVCNRLSKLTMSHIINQLLRNSAKV